MIRAGCVFDSNCEIVVKYFIINKFSILFTIIFVALFSNLSRAESSFDIYGGFQTSPHSKVNAEYYLSGSKIPLEFTAGWKGKSLSMPPYYGIRYTKWDGDIGWGLDFNHTKAYADKKTLLNNGFKHLQFTDGLNNLTLHQQRRFKDVNRIVTSYFGYGIGFTLPHVEIQFDELQPKAFGYQYGGITSAFNSGFRYPMGVDRAIFIEYKFTASWLNVDVEGGGFFKTRIFTNAFNLGYSFEF